MKEQSLSNNILMRSIKLFDIGYINVLNVFFAITIAQFVDKTMGKYDEENASKIPLWKLMIEFLVLIWIYGIIIYTVRNLIGVMPFPLNGYQGYDHFKVKELNMPIVFSFIFVLFCQYFKDRCAYFYKRLTQNITPKELPPTEKKNVNNLV